MRRQTAHLEKVLHTDAHLPDCFEDVHLPAWLRCTEGEQRLPVTLTVILAVILQVELPRRFALQPRYLLPGLEVVLAGGLMAANPRRVNRKSTALRSASLALIAVLSVANMYSALQPVTALIAATAGATAGPPPPTGASRSGTN